jgi:protein-S-isoprenylcysteine O-methyltransferase Ste14
MPWRFGPRDTRLDVSRFGCSAVILESPRIMIFDGWASVYAGLRAVIAIDIADVDAAVKKALVGAALAFGPLAGLDVPFIFAAMIRWRFIRREEAMLRERFGDEAWAAYSRTTRRWI